MPTEVRNQQVRMMIVLIITPRVVVGLHAGCRILLMILGDVVKASPYHPAKVAKTSGSPLRKMNGYTDGSDDGTCGVAQSGAVAGE